MTSFDIAELIVIIASNIFYFMLGNAIFMILSRHTYSNIVRMNMIIVCFIIELILGVIFWIVM